MRRSAKVNCAASRRIIHCLKESSMRLTGSVRPYLLSLLAAAGLAGVDPSGAPILQAPAHPPTMAELMSHTAGFTYGLFGNTPVDKLYQTDPPLNAPSLKAFIDRMATLPLLYQPGERWVYSVSVDIQ